MRQRPYGEDGPEGEDWVIDEAVRVGDLRVQPWWDLIGGRLELVGVLVNVVGKRPLRTTDLRTVALGKIASEHRPTFVLDVDPAGERKPEFYVFPPRPRAGLGRPPIYGEEHWQQVADVYREAYKAGHAPTRAVYRHFNVSESTANKWVAKCRSLGLLPPTTRGKARAIPEAKGRWKS